MAILDWRDNITCLLLPDALANLPEAPDSDHAWQDASGNDRDFFFSPTGCSIVYNALNGYPVVDLDGTDGFLFYSGDLGDFIDNNKGTVFSVFKARTIATNAGNPSLNDAVWAGDAATAAGVYLRSVPEVVAFNRAGGSNFERATAIATGSWYSHMWRHGTGRLAGLVNDALLYTDIASTNTDSLNVDVFLGKNHEATPKVADIQLMAWAALDVELEDQDAQIFHNFLLAKCGVRGDAHGQANSIGARLLWELREPPLRMTIPALPPAAMDIDVGDSIAIAHEDVPHPTGDGAGVRSWERLELAVREVRPNLDTLSVQIVGERPRRHTFYMACQAGVVPEQGLAVSAVQPGPILFKRATPGTQVVSQDGLAWTVRAADGVVAALRDGSLKIEPRGLLSEIGGRNQVLRSAFASGSPAPTGWTLTQPISGGSVASELVADAGFNLWDTAITTRCLKFIRGVTGNGEAEVAVGAPQTSTDQGVVQIDTRGIPAGAKWQLENNSTGDQWDDTAGAWDAGGAENALDADPDEFRQTVSKPIPYQNNAAMTLRIIYDDGAGSPGDVLRVFYVGVIYEQLIIPSASPRLRWPTSRVFSDQSSGTAQMGQDFGPIFPNNVGARNWNVARGAILAKIQPRWNTGDVADVDSTPLAFVIAHAYFDTDNEVLFHYYRDSGGGLGEFRLDVKAAGNVYRAVKAHTVVRDQLIAVWARWTSAADGELDKPARTLTVGVEGAVGTDAQAAAYPTQTDVGWLGITAAANPGPPSHYLLPLNGFCPNLEILDECPPDATMHAWRY
jgi:hypothetical protein